MHEPIEARFWAKVVKTETCWIWTGSKRRGYGQFTTPDGQVEAHRYSYERAFGPVPPGLVLDHVEARGCFTKSCVRPDHLEPVTQGENARRWFSAHAQPTCPNGHDMTDPDNVRLDQGHRRCRTCRREWRRRHYVLTGT